MLQPIARVADLMRRGTRTDIDDKFGSNGCRDAFLMLTFLNQFAFTCVRLPRALPLSRRIRDTRAANIFSPRTSGARRWSYDCETASVILLSGLSVQQKEGDLGKACNFRRRVVRLRVDLPALSLHSFSRCAERIREG